LRFKLWWCWFVGRTTLKDRKRTVHKELLADFPRDASRCGKRQRSTTTIFFLLPCDSSPLETPSMASESFAAILGFLVIKFICSAEAFTASVVLAAGEARD
jgi:hypothetical protein